MNVTFNTGETEKSFTFSATQDMYNDDGESVRLSFGTLPPAVRAGTPSEATVSITDDDDPPEVAFGESAYTVSEGGIVSVEVKLAAALESAVTVPIRHTPQGTTSSGDYSGVPVNVTFNTGETEKSFTFSATQDMYNDDGESVRLSFGTLPPAVRAGTPSEATVSITDDDDPPEVAFGESAYTVSEGGIVSVEVKLAAALESAVTVPIRHTPQGTTSSGDYSGVPVNVTFNTGETEKSFTFSATQDMYNDDGESVRLSFGTLPPAVRAGTPSEATVSITDDDDPPEVAFGESAYTVSEGGIVSVEVKLAAALESAVTVPIRHTPQGTTSFADYTGVPANVTFSAGDTSESFTFAATDDTVDDDGESVLLGFGPLPTDVSTGGTPTSTVTITDNDDPAVTVSFGSATYTVAEGGTQTVTVTLSADPERTVTIPIVTTEQDGASSGDYSGVPANVTFSAGDTSESFTFAATDDTVDDDDESVLLGFGPLPTDVSTGGTPTSTVTITDNDDPAVTVSFGSATYTVAEGGTQTVTVTLSADPERTVTIPLTAAGQVGASSGDYSGVPANVTFSAGDTSESFTFAATDDTVDDDDERVLLGFGVLPTGVSTGGTPTSTVTITDNDDPAVTVSFGSATYTVAEGGTQTVTVTLSADPERTVTIPITTVNQGTASDADYSGVPSGVTFQSGETSKSFDFSATQDTEDDDGESVRLGFGSLPDARVSAGTPDETTVNITDDDIPSSVEVSFGSAAYTVTEGGTVDVTVILDDDPEQTVTVPIGTINEGGASGSDYSGVPATVTFSSGETEKTFTVTATEDNLEDGGEGVKLSFVNLPPEATLGTTNEATVSIINKAAQNSLTVAFQSVAYSVPEGNSVVVTVILSAAPGSEVTVPLTVTEQGGATSADYSGVPASVTFGPDERDQTFTVSATQDVVDDDEESVVIGFGTLSDGVREGGVGNTTVDIRDDDDPAVVVSFGSATYTVAEGGTVEVTVTLDPDPERTVTIPITKVNQGTASDADYSGVPANVVFNSGETEKSITFSATQDTIDDDGESVRLAFGSPLPTDVTAASPQEAVVSITDDDVPSVTVSFEQGTYTVAEGGTVEVTVTLDPDPERTVTIPITKVNQGTASDADYSGVPANVVFNSGETEKSITFSATQDTIDDDGESVRLAFGSPLPTDVTAASPQEAVVSITDDDVPSVTVSFEQGTYTVAEGGTVEVTVTLDPDPERTVTIPITKVNQGTASDADYSGVPANVVFNSGETEKSITFSATQDTIDDDGESVRLAFGSPLPTDVTAASPQEAVVSITDDDVPSVTVSFEQGTYTVAEGGTQTVTVTLSADPERTVTIPIIRTNQDGASNGDYSGVPASVTFNNGDTSESFTFTATDDTVDDDGESVLLTFGAMPDGVSAGTPTETTVTITDDDAAAGKVTLELTPATINESGTGNASTVTASIPSASSAATTVTVSVNPGGHHDADREQDPDHDPADAGDDESRNASTVTARSGPARPRRSRCR